MKYEVCIYKALTLYFFSITAFTRILQTLYKVNNFHKMKLRRRYLKILKNQNLATFN